jgi:hypothetical protein
MSVHLKIIPVLFMCKNDCYVQADSKSFFLVALVFYAADRLFHFHAVSFGHKRHSTILFTCKKKLSLEKVSISLCFKTMFLMWLSCVYQGLSET